jgi:hypothetical protein
MATADMAGQAWVNHTAPEKYTRQTLELSRQTLQTTADQLLQSPPPEMDTAALHRLLRVSGDRIAQMARFVQSRNAPAVSAQLDTLRAETQTVGQIADRTKAAE